MKTKIILLFNSIFLFATGASAQFCGVRMNTVALATGTINPALEVMVDDKYTVDLCVLWNPVNSDNLKLNFTGLQSGVRRWFYEAFAGHFLSAHISYANYNIGNSKHYYKGWLTGAGLSYGYAWLMNERWNLNIEAGLGIFHTRDSKRFNKLAEYENQIIRHYRRWILGPSKCEVSFTYLF